MNRRYSLGDLQLAIMRVLWERGDASVTEVHTALLEERGLAPTTIATMLVKMEKKGVVAHHREGRRFIYQPTISEEQVRRGMVQDKDFAFRPRIARRAHDTDQLGPFRQASPQQVRAAARELARDVAGGGDCRIRGRRRSTARPGF